jgi:hypothetical protein
MRAREAGRRAGGGGGVVTHSGRRARRRARAGAGGGARGARRGGARTRARRARRRRAAALAAGAPFCLRGRPRRVRSADSWRRRQVKRKQSSRAGCCAAGGEANDFNPCQPISLPPFPTFAAPPRGRPATMSTRPSSSQGGREGGNVKRHKNDLSKQIHDIILSRLDKTNITENTDLDSKAGWFLAAGFIKACQSLQLPGAIFRDNGNDIRRLWDDLILMGLILTAYLKCDFSQVLSNGTRASPRKFLCGLTWCRHRKPLRTKACTQYQSHLRVLRGWLLIENRTSGDRRRKCCTALGVRGRCEPACGSSLDLRSRRMHQQP